MPSVTVVPGDRLIIVDSVPIVFESPFSVQPHGPGEMHALQWNGTSGEIEWTDDYNWPLELEAYEDEVAPYVALWQAEKARREKAAAEAAEEYNSLASTKARKLAEINAACDAALAALTAGYPSSELLTFDKQEAEARALLADPEAATPFLTPLAAARGLETEELARKVIAKADAFTTASGHVIGLRQKDEDRLKAAQSVEDVAAIVPEYRLPEAG